ncbi:MAG: type IV secretory system conjugative DNA transfer family protein [Colwellia sp.]|nr:type IV secretory system conjugative DNA transfer family protein [Colwellia sp.]
MVDRTGARSLIDASAALSAYLIITMTLIMYGGFERHPLVLFSALKEFGTSWPFWMQLTTACAGMTAFLILILNPFRESHAYGSASFATNKMIEKWGLFADEGIIIGVKDGRYLRFKEALSVFLFAPPDSGKTVGVIIPTLLSTSNSVIAHDPKFELFKKTAPHRLNFSTVIKFAPGELESDAWNPLSQEELPTEWDDKVVVVDRLCKSFFTSGDPEKDKSDHWVKEARSLFMFWALYLINKNGFTSLPEVRKKNAQCRDVQEAIAEIIDHHNDYQNIEKDEISPGIKLPERVIEEANRMLSKADKEFSSVASTFAGYMDIFGDPRISKNMDHSDFKLSDFRSECHTLYLCVRAIDQSRLRPVMSMFFEYCVLTFLDKEPEKDEQSITLLLDEFVRLGRLQEVLQLPAISRSFRVNALFVSQSESQVSDIYGEKGLAQLIDTCAYQVVFTQNKESTAKRISDAIGPKTRKRRSYSTQRDALTRNMSENEEGVPLLLPQDISSLGVGEIVILVQKHFKNPIMAKVPFWFKDRTQKGLVNLEDFESLSEFE